MYIIIQIQNIYFRYNEGRKRMDEKQIRKLIREDLEYYDKNPDKLKEEFIKQFGEKLWNQQEELSKLLKIEDHLSNLLNLERIPVIVEDILEDSRYIIKENYIVISSKIIYNQTEAIKALVHEYKHYHQYCIVDNNIPHPLFHQWKENLQNPYQPQDFNDSEQMTRYYLQPIELDAYAFTKYYFKKYLNKKINQLHPLLEQIFDKYIKKYYNN